MHDAGQITFFWLILIASVVAMAVRHIKLPYTVALVFSGLIIGYLGVLPQVHLEPHTLFAVFLPPLIFEAGIHIKIQNLKKDAWLIGCLALVGTLLSTAIIGSIVHLGLGLSITAALLFGAIISPTDPISVIAMFKRLGVPHRLAMIVEGESLFNDGIAVVLFSVLLHAVVSGDASVAGGIQQLIFTVAGGLIVGTIIGAVASRLTKEFDDHLLEITLTTIVAYGSYLAAEAVHVSGVIAVVAASLVVGNYGIKEGMTPSSRLAVFSFWEYAAFIVNSLVFLIIGIEEATLPLFQSITPVLLAMGAALVARAVSVYGIMRVVGAADKELMKWPHAVFWSGLRGGLSMAMALGLPLTLPEREPIILMTYGVVLISLSLQGLTVERLIKKLGLVSVSKNDLAYQQLIGENLTLYAARAELEKNAARGLLTQAVFEQEATRLTERQRAIEAIVGKLHDEQPHLAESEAKKVRLISLTAQRNALKEAEASGIVSAEAAEEVASRLEEEYEDQKQQ